MRAIGYAPALHDQPPTLLELCRHSHASPRTLQYCFQAVLGESLARYIKILRLNGSRHDLKRLDENVLISDIAAKRRLLAPVAVRFRLPPHARQAALGDAHRPLAKPRERSALLQGALAGRLRVNSLQNRSRPAVHSGFAII